MEQEEVFAYLVDLRDSGVTNMWGAPAYLERDLGLSKEEAKKHFFAWMDSFEDKV